MAVRSCPGLLFYLIRIPLEVKEIPCWPEAEIMTDSQMGSKFSLGDFQSTPKFPPVPPCASSWSIAISMVSNGFSSIGKSK